MLIPSTEELIALLKASLSRRVNANSQLQRFITPPQSKLIKKGEC